MIFKDDWIDEEEYEHKIRTIIDGDLMNMSLIITEGNYCAIDADGSKCNGYYIISVFPYPYTLQVDLSIDKYTVVLQLLGDSCSS